MKSTVIYNHISNCFSRFFGLHENMIRKIILMIIFLTSFFGTAIDSEAQGFIWAKSIGSSNDEYGQSLKVDAFGNVYTTGAFRETVDFDPGFGTYNISSAGQEDIFICKLDAFGNFVWAKSIGSTGYDGCNGIEFDAAGNIFLTGYYSGTVDFDPGAGTYNLTSNGSDDIFVCKLNSQGDFIWAKSIGGTTGVQVYGMAIDEGGDAIITGSFYGTCDFDPGAGIYELTSSGDRDIFLCRLTSAGNFSWAVKMGGSGIDVGYSVAIDVGGNILSCGTFHNSADFDPGTGSFPLTAVSGYDAYVSKLSSGGTFIWASQFGGSQTEYAKSLCTDVEGCVYTTGYFSETADFNPGTAVYNLTSAGEEDIFVCKLEADGSFVWAAQIGGNEWDRGLAIAIDDNTNVYISGYFMGTADFNPGTGVYNLASSGLEDIFICKLNAIGNLIWAIKMGGTLTDASNTIHVNNTGQICTSGYFLGTSDFDPDEDIYNLSSMGGQDVFICKITNNGCMDTYSTIDITECLSYVSPSGEFTWTESGIYNDTIPNATGCDSILTINLFVGDTTEPVVLVSNVTVYLDAVGNASITESMINNGSTDNCAIESVTLNVVLFNCDDVGENTVNLTVTDESGNSASASAVVTVLDSISPVVTAKDIEINMNGQSSVSIIPADVDNGSYDNCSIDLSLDQSTFYFPGTYSVMLTAKDPSGNTSSSSAIITVVNETALKPFEPAHITIYPNPASGKIFIELKEDSVPDIVGIYDVKGIMVSSFRKMNVSSVEMLPAGNYTVLILSGGKQITLPLIIER